MKKPKNRSAVFSFLRRAVGMLTVFAVTLSLVLIGLSGTGKSVRTEGLRRAEDNIRRAAVSCYALEGYYPESYEYLQEYYGLEINEELYTVHYTAIASNIMPEITVIKR